MEKNARNFVLDNMLAMSAYWACSGSVVASLTSYYNMPLSLANVVTGFTSTLLVLQLFGGFAYARCTKRFAFLRITNAAWRVLLPLAFLSVLLPKSIGTVMMVVFYFCGIAVYQFACPPQTDWLVSAVEGRVKSDYYSMREMCFMFTYTAVFCAVSLFIDHADKAGTQRAGFIQVGLLSAVLLGLSVWVLTQLPAPAPAQPHHHTAAQIFSEPFRNKEFLRVLITNMVWSFAGMFIGSFAAVYQIRILGLSFSSIMLWATVGNLLRSVATPLMAHLAARITWKNVTALCIFVQACTALGWFFVTAENVWLMFPLLSVTGTVPYAGMGVGFLKMQVDTTPAATRSMYFSVNATLNGAAAFLGSMACSGLIAALERLYGGEAAAGHLHLIFLAGLGAALVSVVFALRIRSNAR